MAVKRALCPPVTLHEQTVTSALGANCVNCTGAYGTHILIDRYERVSGRKVEVLREAF